MQELRNVHVSCKCPLVVELHVVVDELCCYQEQDYNHWYDPTHCCALRISSVLGRLDVFTPVEVVFGHFWNYWKYFMPDEQNQQMCVPVTEISQLSQGFIVRSYQWHKKDCRKVNWIVHFWYMFYVHIHRVINSKVDKLKQSVFQNLEHKIYRFFLFFFRNVSLGIRT